MDTIETKLKKKVMDYYNLLGWKIWKISDRYNSGRPDIYMLKNGRSIWLELKRPGEEPTELQFYELNGIIEHGGEAIWSQSLEETKFLINGNVYKEKIDYEEELGGIY